MNRGDRIMFNGFDPKDADRLPQATRTISERRDQVLGPAYRLFYSQPVHIVRAEGVHLYDASGVRYLDAYNNVPSVGHCHPWVVDAIARQAAVLNTHTRYVDEALVDYAERLVATLPNEVDKVMFTCSGSEANDLALRVARAFTGGSGVIVTENAYHGTTARTAECSPALGAGVPLGAHVRTVPSPEQGTDGHEFAQQVRAATADLHRHGIRPAALLVDTIFSSDGVLPDQAGFLAPAVAAIRDAGAVLIADEVQAGFGRTGATMWGFQRHGIVPDLVVMGKPMGNGHPIAAMAARPRVLDPFARLGRYFNTFGGNSVSIAAAAAVLDVLEEEALRDKATHVGTYLLGRLAALAERDQRITGVRGAGLFIAVQFHDHRQLSAVELTQAVVDGLRQRCILVSATGKARDCLKIRPPLPFAIDHAEQLAQALEATLQDIRNLA